MAASERHVRAGRRPGRPISAALALAIAALLAGCGSSDNSRFALVVIGQPADPFETGARLSPAGQLSRAATAEGLVSFDEQGRVVPALADRWIVTDDGQSYIFRLRDGTWRNGEPLTAKAAKDALDRAIRALRGTPLALDLNGIDEIRVMASRVVEIRLLRPMPYFLQIMAQPELGLLHDRQGNGPMTIEREDGAVARFTPIEPSRLGLPVIDKWDRRTRQLDLAAVPAGEAVRRFNEGDVDLVLGGQIQDFPLTGSVGILRGTIQLDPVIGLLGLQVANDRGFLSDPQNREALSMAIDRQALIAPFGLSGWTSTTRLVSHGVQGDLGPTDERWGDLSLEERQARAATRVRQSNPAGVAGLSVWLPAGPGSDILFARLAADWRKVGVTVTRAPDWDSADLRLIDEVARYPRVAWFLNRLSCVARRGLCDSGADALAASAAAVNEPRRRAEILSEAEARLTAANTFIPFGSPIRWSLVRGGVDGFAPNPWGWHPLMPLAWLPK